MCIKCPISPFEAKKDTKVFRQNRDYSVSHIITYPSKELCSKMALGEVSVPLP